MLCRYYTLTVKGVVFLWTVFAELQVLGCAHTKNATAPLDQSEQEETGGCSFDEERLSLLNLCVCMYVSSCACIAHMPTQSLMLSQYKTNGLMLNSCRVKYQDPSEKLSNCKFVVSDQFGKSLSS